MNRALGLLLTVVVGVCLAFDPSTYTSSQQLLPEYTVYWRADEAAKILYLALRVQTTGWVGFGIAELSSGSMPGSDIVTGYVKNGKGSITDRWAHAFVLPEEDSCQDWALVSSDESDGYTTLEVKRHFDTGDAQDRVIIGGPNRVVCAFGADGEDEISYHNANRITSVITFFGSASTPSLPTNAQFIDLRMGNYTIPNGETHYVCMAFEVPVDQKYHVIQIDPLLDQANIEHVHHYLVHICKNTTNGYIQKYQQPGGCVSPVGNVNSGCTGLTAAWAAGGGSTVLPLEAGFPMGGDDTNSIHHIILEIHYNNPGAGAGGYTDDSGVRLWYTTELRQYDAAMITLGDPAVDLWPIPARSITEYETECPDFCTQLLPNDLVIFQSFPHMHEVGSEIWTTQWRDGVEIAQWGRIEFWSFDHQQSQPVNFTLKPGDRLNTHCVYDTTNKSDVTQFGTATTQEMCMHFLSYYPRVIINNDLWPYCGYVNYDPWYTVCGQGVEEDLYFYANPTVRDPPGGMNKTFGVTAATCPKDDIGSSATNSFPASFVILLSLFIVLVLRMH